MRAFIKRRKKRAPHAAGPPETGASEEEWRVESAKVCRGTEDVKFVAFGAEGEGQKIVESANLSASLSADDLRAKPGEGAASRARSARAGRRPEPALEMAASTGAGRPDEQQVVLIGGSDSLHELALAGGSDGKEQEQALSLANIRPPVCVSLDGGGGGGGSDEDPSKSYSLAAQR